MSDDMLPTAAAEAFERWIARSKFAPATGALYAAKVSVFMDWLEARWEEYDGALSDEHLRDYAVRDFRRHLMTERKLAVNTVESYLSAISTFYDVYLQIGRPNVTRAGKSDPKTKALSEDALRRALRAAERRGVRDYAIARLLFGTGMRVSSLVALDTDDVFVTERQGQVEIRHAKGGQALTVFLAADERQAVRAWLAARKAEGHPEVGPLFYSRVGQRISKRRVQSLMTTLGEAAGERLTPHVMRHTYARFFLDNGGDVGELQQNLGHKHLSSTQVYTGASSAHRAESAERVRIDL
jgi:integrase/recombinase XerC